MNFIEAPQGTDAWYQARAGKITASRFADAISTIGRLDERQAKYVSLVRSGMSKADAAAEAGYKVMPSSDLVRRALLGEDTAEPSDIAKRYAADLAIERISLSIHGEPAKAWVLERGHEMEARARILYEVKTGTFITEAGICATDDGVFGYSTDGLAGDDGLIEIKAPIDSAKILAMWRTGDTSEYDHQMQGGMWITGRKWCDFIMYVPGLAAAGKDMYVKRIMRDDAFIDSMVEQLSAFDNLVREYEAVFREESNATAIGETMNNTTSSDEQSVAERQANERSAALLAKQSQEAALRSALRSTADAAAANVTANALAEQGRLTDMADQVVREEQANTPPSLRLGQINERIAPLQISAEGLRALGFEHAATDKAAKLYHEHQFPSMCAALCRHIAAAQAKYSVSEEVAA